MQWKLSEEQDAYQETFREWLADVAPSEAVRRWLDAGDASAFESRFVAGGWAGVGLPEELGGQGGGLVELALTAEELARAAAPSAAWLATVLAVPALAGRIDLVGTALAGETVALLVPAETVPDEALSLRADARGVVTGTAARVLAGDTATWFVVPVGEGDARELRLVEAAVPGVTLTDRRLLDRSRSVADVTLDQVPSVRLDVDAADVLRQASARAAVLVAADSLGASERMLDLAVEYSKQRHQFGVPIGSFQAVKHAAATILVGVEAARSAVYFAAASVEGGDPQSLLHAAAVKAQVTAEGVRSADSALTVHGAIGYTWEHDLHLFFKRAKLDEQLFGAPAAWNERIADGLALL
ncbi:acyl-CoA dehydrogenase family protein [Streptomyces sp. NPDC058424]|uniref:acyl-CoA dehydrogenase family protein n=1 Tax=Streptomyces sp. NPDC058424 TaxID=3346491 RepID=UPI003655CC25